MTEPIIPPVENPAVPPVPPVTPAITPLISPVPAPTLLPVHVTFWVFLVAKFKVVFNKRWLQWILIMLALVVLGTGSFFLFRQRVAVKATLFAVQRLIVSRVQPKPVVVRPSPPPIPQPIKITSTTLDGATFTAQHIIVKDVTSGQVLFAKDEYTPQPLASVTKLLSALVLLDQPMDWTTTTLAAAGDLNDAIILPDERYRLETLWNAALVASSNRSIVTLADATGLPRPEFIARMNAKARELGMANTFIEEPTGLSEHNTSTASDVALLIAEALKHDKIKTALNVRQYTITTVDKKHSNSVWSTDLLLLRWVPHSLPNFLGGKTGFIPAAGYNFAMQTANENGHVITVVMLGTASSTDRFSEARDAAQWVFRNFRWSDDPIVTSTVVTTSSVQK